ncbi:hypothetical protein ACC690_37215, partial [Rhizobium johnstonii]|uniref:hypothetical protein n=1 Tax=Rhizobium johnstonii TaxID=3019933 RepID=UPI003F9D76CF
TDIYTNHGEAFQVSTAAGADGIRRRIEFRASSENHQGDWAVFALATKAKAARKRAEITAITRPDGDLGSMRSLVISCRFSCLYPYRWRDVKTSHGHATDR